VDEVVEIDAEAENEVTIDEAATSKIRVRTIIQLIILME